MAKWSWWRVSTLVVTAIGGLWLPYEILTAPYAQRWALLLCGPLLIAGVLAAACCALLGWMIVVEDIRPRVRFRKPSMPMSLSHDEAALVGQRRFRQHPVTFWAGLILNDSFFIGFMTFSPAEYVTLDEREAAA